MEHKGYVIRISHYLSAALVAASVAPHVPSLNYYACHLFTPQLDTLSYSNDLFDNTLNNFEHSPCLHQAESARLPPRYRERGPYWSGSVKVKTNLRRHPRAQDPPLLSSKMQLSQATINSRQTSRRRQETAQVIKNHHRG
jgi:hypothetical protein